MSRTRGARTWLPLLLASLAACGGGARESIGEAPSGVVRPRLAPAGDRRGEVAVIDSFELDDDLSRAGSFDPRKFNQVLVHGRVEGIEVLSLEFLRGGEALGRADHSVVTTSDRQLFTFTLPPRLYGSEPFDELRLTGLGLDPARVELDAVSLVARPLELFLPDPAAEPELIWMSSDGRRGVGVTTAAPVGTSFSLPESASALHLTFSYAEPREVRRLGREVALVVSFACGGDEVIRERRVLPAAMDELTWSRASLDLAPLSRFAGRELVGSFRVESSDGQPAAVALAELQVAPSIGARPSVLLVTTDTHRADHVGFGLDGVPIQTPALDALAARGLVFERCFTAINSTNPSHASLLTGEHPRDVGVLSNREILGAQAITLAERFAEQGYATWAAVSARHLTGYHSGLGQGFDRMTGPRVGGDREAALTVADVTSWLDECETRPLFVWLHVFDAHTPYEVTPEQEQRYPIGPEHDDFAFTLPRFLRGVPEDADARRQWETDARRDVVRHQRARYKAEVTYLDGELGRVFGRAPFAAGSDSVGGGLVAVVGDHGENLGQHGIYFDHQGLYPDTLHVPLVLAGPGVPSGARYASMVAQGDVGRTLLDLAGFEDASFPGRNLVGREERAEPHFALHSDGFSAALTIEDYHLILHLEDGGPGRGGFEVARHQVELFDLAADRACEVDLAETEVERAKGMRRALVRWLGEARSLGWSEAARVDAELDATLNQLGYAEAHSSRSALWSDDECAWCKRYR